MKRYLVKKVVVYAAHAVIEEDKPLALGDPVDEDYAASRVEETDGACGVAVEVVELTPELEASWRAAELGEAGDPEPFNNHVAGEVPWRRLFAKAADLWS